MHKLFKHITSFIKILLLSFLSVFLVSTTSAEQSIEDIIKGRQALFSKNYSTAKRVQSYASNGDFDESIELMLEMSENYKVLIDLFPENTKEGFKTEALPIIWEEKDAFNALMKKASDDMVTLASVIEDSDDIRGTLKQLMWSNCKACHSKYRMPH
tara:strand:- start:433 stop:900 length:468 start_codon:yes stop_codon:yes gene_type:complete